MSGRRSIGARIDRDGVRLAGGGIVMAPETALGRAVSQKQPQNASGATLALAALSEAEFQAEHVVKGLTWRRWVVMVIPDMRMVQAGWPDVCAWHPDIPGVLLLWELKTTTGHVSHAQKRVLGHLRTVPGIDARIVRPSDWEKLRDCLDSADPIVALARIKEEV